VILSSHQLLLTIIQICDIHMMWTLWQYKEIADSFLAHCDEGMRDVLVRRLTTLAEKGVQCKMPVSEPLGDGLFSLRGRSGRERGRLVYYFGTNRQIIFIHAFWKTTQRIDNRDMEVAKRNKRLIEEGREGSHGFDFTDQTKYC
jgi:phage-related protein